MDKSALRELAKIARTYGGNVVALPELQYNLVDAYFLETAGAFLKIGKPDIAKAPLSLLSQIRKTSVKIGDGDVSELLDAHDKLEKEVERLRAALGAVVNSHEGLIDLARVCRKDGLPLPDKMCISIEAYDAARAALESAK